MIKFFIKILLALVFLIFASCNETEKGFKISASLYGFSKNTKVIITNVLSEKILDSAKVINGKFTANGILDNPPSLIRIEIISEKNEERDYTTIFIGNENITITGSRKDFVTGFDVKGTKFNKLKVELDAIVNPLYDKRDDKLQEMFGLRNDGKWNDSLQNAYWSKTGMITKIDNEISQTTKQFISKNINSHYALSQLVFYKNDFEKEFIQKQLEKLNSEFVKTEYFEALKTFLESNPLKTGDSFYNFTAENQRGESVDFSSFFNNTEFTLLEFYSPNCGWCKKALPEIKFLEKSNKDKLQVVTYNVDRNKEDWLKTTKSNGISWISLWNEKGRFSDAYIKYNISGTPTYYLFNQQGKVLNKWTGYDENLISSIKQLID